jgi:hypothetical protein
MVLHYYLATSQFLLHHLPLPPPSTTPLHHLPILNGANTANTKRVLHGRIGAAGKRWWPEVSLQNTIVRILLAPNCTHPHNSLRLTVHAHELGAPPGGGSFLSALRHPLPEGADSEDYHSCDNDNGDDEKDCP